LVHINVKMLVRFRKVEHRIAGNRQQGLSTGVGYDLIHVAIDDTTRLAYDDVLAGEQQVTAMGLICRALAWFNGQGFECRQVMSDNDPAYVSRQFAKACKVLGLKHIRNKPNTPRTNGMAERFTHTHCKEWAYSMPFRNSVEQNLWLPRYPSIYTASGSTQPSAAYLLSSGTMSC